MEDVFLNYVVCCHNENCENAEIKIPILVPQDGTVICGVCGNEIIDKVVQS
jgi:hypothetical protein